MAESLIDELPLAQRLALAYAPAGARPATLALLALDARLGQAVRQASEPVIGQMRLAWWRDQFGLDPRMRERNDLLMGSLDVFAGEADSLTALVDGWELLLDEKLDTAQIRAFASARAQAFLALKRVIGSLDDAEAILSAGQQWALADLVTGLSETEERSRVIDLWEESHRGLNKLSRNLRPLAVLEGLARRSLSSGGTPMLHGPGAAITAIRLGLVGR